MDESNSGSDLSQLSHAPLTLLDCDVVFRGGITSGVVYPGAVAALAEHYRFRSIGGASAGAIAAGVAAAAEYGRQRGNTAAFADVERIATEVGGGAGGLRRLFRARGALRPLEWVVWAVLSLGRRGTLAVLFLVALLVAFAAVTSFGSVWAGLAFFLAVPVLLRVRLESHPQRALRRSSSMMDAA